MAERIPGNHEKRDGHENFARQPEHLALPTAEQAEPLRLGEQDPTQALNAELARSVVEHLPDVKDPLEGLKKAEKESEHTPPLHINSELKRITKDRELLHIQRRESAPVRSFSKLVHQPAVRAISDAASGTVSRPSGLLGGGLVALIGTSAYLYLSRHMGFEYNYFVFVLLFLAGFGIGLGLELLVWTATSSRRHAND